VVGMLAALGAPRSVAALHRQAGRKNGNSEIWAENSCNERAAVDSSINSVAELD
jgi:hypothetical protein